MGAPSFELELAVRNVARVLEGRVARLLDVLAEQKERFSLRIIDEGSTDETLDVARDLARQYPQIRVEARKVADRASDNVPILRLHAAGGVEPHFLASLSRLVQPKKTSPARRLIRPRRDSHAGGRTGQQLPPGNNTTAASSTSPALPLRMRRRRPAQKF
ncbi:MAG: hypothetical protein KatS3mg110_2106 [Pirellulaceae bacterium]|nr:MAG: hypothetical protein KatS3mg110_2106 [Pirellulaceae bacterium]